MPRSKLVDVLLLLAAAADAVFWFNIQNTATPVNQRTDTDKTLEVTNSTGTIATADTITTDTITANKVTPPEGTVVRRLHGDRHASQLLQGEHQEPQACE